VTRREAYRAHLRDLPDWDPYLLAESGLPGPRGNLELAQAAVDEGGEDRFRRWIALGPAQAPVNSPEEFLAFCGILGLGKLLAEAGDAAVRAMPAGVERSSGAAAAAEARSSTEASLLATLARFAADPRWRSREAVAMALQRWGDADMDSLLGAMAKWSRGTAWEQRAAAAALCEPRLLANRVHAAATLGILDRITASLEQSPDRKQESFRVLRQGLGYCWSVAVCACPEDGKQMMERWFASRDADVRWVMRENLRKNRLARLDPQWTARWLAELA
jgi:hypothetical protein